MFSCGLSSRLGPTVSVADEADYKLTVSNTNKNGMLRISLNNEPYKEADITGETMYDCNTTFVWMPRYEQNWWEAWDSIVDDEEVYDYVTLTVYEDENIVGYSVVFVIANNVNSEMEIIANKKFPLVDGKYQKVDKSDVNTFIQRIIDAHKDKIAAHKVQQDSDAKVVCESLGTIKAEDDGIISYIDDDDVYTSARNYSDNGLLILGFASDEKIDFRYPANGNISDVNAVYKWTPKDGWDSIAEGETLRDYISLILFKNNHGVFVMEGYVIICVNATSSGAEATVIANKCFPMVDGELQYLLKSNVKDIMRSVIDEYESAL